MRVGFRNQRWRCWPSMVVFAVAVVGLAACGGDGLSKPTPGDSSTSAGGSSSTLQASEGTTMVVGPAGGEVSGPDGVVVSFPEGSVSEEVNVEVRVASTPEIPGEAVPAGDAYSVSLSDDVAISGVVTLSLPLQRVPAGEDDRYTVLRWDGSNWEDVGGLVEGDLIRVQLSEISLFQPAYSGIIHRPVSFVNHGPNDAVAHPWTYLPAEEGGSTVFPDPSTASFAPGAPGGWPNPSRFLSLPLGTYTWCYDWDTGEDRDGDGYADWFHTIDDRPVTLTIDSPQQHALAVTVDFSTDPPDPIPGRCQPGTFAGLTDAETTTTTTTVAAPTTQFPLRYEGGGTIAHSTSFVTESCRAEGSRLTVELLADGTITGTFEPVNSWINGYLKHTDGTFEISDCQAPVEPGPFAITGEHQPPTAGLPGTLQVSYLDFPDHGIVMEGAYTADEMVFQWRSERLMTEFTGDVANPIAYIDYDLYLTPTTD